jgi:SAM-dependent methyltransferase
MSVGAAFKSVDEFMAAQAALLEGITIVDRSCPICAHPNLRTPPSKYSLGPWPVKRCVRCHCVYITRMPEQEALVSRYDWSRSSKLEDAWRESSRPVVEGISRRSRWRTKLIRRRSLAERVADLIGSGAIIDVGCGDGVELTKLPPQIEAVGIEISSALAERARERLQHRNSRVIADSALGGLESLDDNSCHGAVLRSYLEHEAEPLRVLQQLGRVLVRDGVALIKVPNFASWNRLVMGRHWCGFRHPDHLNYFTPATLGLLASIAGFESRFAFRDALPTGDNMVATLINRKTPRSVNELLPVAA